MSFNIGKNIKNLRIENQMSESELSTLLSCRESLIKAWENEEEYPDIMLLPKIASIFNVSIDYLTTGEVSVHKNYDQILNQISKKDDVNQLDDDIIKGIDKKNNSLIDYVIKNESVKIFTYLIKNNKLKYAINNRDINNLTDDLIYLALISNNIKLLPQIGINDIAAVKKWPEKALIAFVCDNRINDDEIDYILTMHTRDIKEDEYIYMPNDNRHVKGLWQLTYPKLLEYSIKYENINLAHKIYKAMFDANGYALTVIRDELMRYTLYTTPLSKYKAQDVTNIPIAVVSIDLLNLMLEKKYFTILRYFNKLNKQLNQPYIDEKEINEKELLDDRNATDMDILRIKYVRNDLLDIKNMLKAFNKPSEYEKQVLFNMINNYPISYLEYVNTCLINKTYKKLFEFSIDYELDTLALLIMSKRYDEILNYTVSIFGYYDVLNDGHIKTLKEKIKTLSNDAIKFDEENNTYQKNRCYERISKLINDEQLNWTFNLVHKKSNLNKNMYKEMLDTQNEFMSFSNLMQMNETNIKKISDTYKLRLYNDYLKKVGMNNE